MLAPFTLAIAIAMTPVQAPSTAAPAITDWPISRLVEGAVFEQARGTPLAGPVQPRGGDSLQNGAKIGAIVAGAAMFVTTTWLCLATREDSGSECVGPVFFWTAAGAGAGALIGAGVDALIQRRVSVRWTVRF